MSIYSFIYYEYYSLNVFMKMYFRYHVMYRFFKLQRCVFPSEWKTKDLKSFIYCERKISLLISTQYTLKWYFFDFPGS